AGFAGNHYPVRGGFIRAEIKLGSIVAANEEFVLRGLLGDDPSGDGATVVIPALRIGENLPAGKLGDERRDVRTVGIPWVGTNHIGIGAGQVQISLKLQSAADAVRRGKSKRVS